LTGQIHVLLGIGVVFSLRNIAEISVMAVVAAITPRSV
jgi:hypothetical protein